MSNAARIGPPVAARPLVIPKVMTLKTLADVRTPANGLI
jgi:hypothetical protein